MATHGRFLWSDLSSKRPETTKPFYQALFGWRFGPGPYAVASDGSRPVAAVFEMPETFQKMGLPSFWMTYIGVDDIDATVAAARAHGGKVELGPEPFEAGGRFALIRDPLGAGFTLFEGTDLGTASAQSHSLFVSDAGAVMPFYQALFGWHFDPAGPDRWRISAGGHLHQLPDAQRGKEQYWAVLTQAPTGTSGQVANLGGRVEATLDLPEGRTDLIRDPDNAALFLVEGGVAPAGSAPATALPWRSWLGLALIALAVATGWGWINAIFLAIWIALGLRDRATYLFEPVERDRTPILYWLVLAAFAGLAVLSVLYPGLQ